MDADCGDVKVSEKPQSSEQMMCELLCLYANVFNLHRSIEKFLPQKG